MKRTYIVFAFLATIGCLFASGIKAQEVWTLRSCIEYARQQNIQVQKSQVSAESYSVDVLQSKAALFPSLTGSVSQRLANSQVANSNGDYKYEQTFAGEYSLNASVTVYNGNRNRDAIKTAQMKKSAQDLTTQELQNSIEISITQAYLQMLYTRESIKNNENIVATSEAELKQAKIFLDAGSTTRSEYAQVEAQYSSDKYNLVLAQNSYDNYKLQLKQLLELDQDVDFEVAFPEVGDDEVLQMVASKRDVYSTALAIMPEIKNSKLGIDIANLSKKTAKSGYLPSVSLTGSIGTGNIYNQSPSFFTQLDRNFNQSIGVSVSIPIFDNRQNKSNVQKADLDIRTAELELLDTQKTLLKTIEGLYQDVVSAQSKYIAAKDQLNSTRLSYELVQEQFNLGMRNTVELTTEKNNYTNALQNLLQAKYTALLSLKLLNFYQGQEISL
ncbi:MAG: TolC family protein [Dysgonomonas sp.]|uniref:TolC family protein n=1 Tax=Dysgonomonas sp. TaxID=1891233 RepID=UPI0039E5DF03